MPKFVFAFATAVALAAFGIFNNHAAEAAPIFVPNGDFEQDAATRGSQQNSAPPNWTSSGVFGTMKPSDLGYYDETNPGFLSRGHGELVAFAQGGATLSQTLNDTYQADTQYNLSVLVGDSYEGVGGEYEIRLLADSDLLASFGGPYPAAAFTVETAIASFSTADIVDAVGKNITIEIFAATGNTKTFDNVMLTAVPLAAVPEPSTVALGLLGMLGLVCLGRKRLRASRR